MLHIKNFINKMSAMEGKKSKDVVLPINDAKGLRDDICKLLADLHELNREKNNEEEVINVSVKGGGFR
jgi:hypothetical protein